MNHDEPREFTSDEQRAIDLLVDGELDQSAQRSLLASLDSTPDGWRRLALAYVEDQTLRQNLRDLIAAPPEAVAAPSSAPAPRPKPAVWSRAGGIGLAMAASFLLVFGLGWHLRSDGPAAAPSGVNGAPTDVQPTVTIPLVTTPHQATDVEETPTVVHSNGQTIAHDDRAPGVPPPVVAAGHGIHLSAPDAPSALPAHVLRALERLGHRVESRRHRIPIHLPDGRRAVVPVEDVEVHYVGIQPYQ